MDHRLGKTWIGLDFSLGGVSCLIGKTVKLNITDKLTIKWGRVWVSGKTKGWSIEEVFSPLPISTSPFPFFDGLSVFVNCIQTFFVR